MMAVTCFYSGGKVSKLQTTAVSSICSVINLSKYTTSSTYIHTHYFKRLFNEGDGATQLLCFSNILNKHWLNKQNIWKDRGEVDYASHKEDLPSEIDCKEGKFDAQIIDFMWSILLN